MRMREMSTHSLRHRLDLIEDMISEGRRTTEGWGVYLAIWGLGHTLGWLASYLWRVQWVWHLAVPVCFVVAALRRRRADTRQRSWATQAVRAVWLATAIAMSLVALLALPLGQVTWQQTDLFILVTLGLANFASGTILRWTLQRGVGLAWWAAAVLALFLPGPWTVGWLFLGAALTLELGFGVYLMWRDRHAAQG
jgi:hypothetical protein